MAQSIKYEDLSSEPQHVHKKADCMSVTPVLAGTRGVGRGGSSQSRDRRISEAYTPAKLSIQAGELPVVVKTLSQKNKEERD